MIYALFIENEEDGENYDAENAAFESLKDELGRTGFASGQDNGWSCCAVDSKEKLSALERAAECARSVLSPEDTVRVEDIEELHPSNYALWAMLFGEFDPKGTPEDWYKIACGE